MTCKCHCGKIHEVKIHGASLDYAPATIECPDCEQNQYLCMKRRNDELESQIHSQ